MTKSFMIWWLLTVIQLITFGIAVIYFDAYNYLMGADATKLSFVIIAIWGITTFNIGWNSFYNKHEYGLAWFSAETCMSIGMVGTLIGFILMLSNSLGEIDPSNIQAMKIVIGDMAKGMSTALITTLAGLVSNILIKIQVVSQEYNLLEK